MGSKFVSNVFLKSFSKQLAAVSPRNGEMISNYVQQQVPIMVEQDLQQNLSDTTTTTTTTGLGKKNMNDDQRTNLTLCASVYHGIIALEQYGGLQTTVDADSNNDGGVQDREGSSVSKDDISSNSSDLRGLDPLPQEIVADAICKIPAANLYMKHIFPKVVGFLGNNANEQGRNLVDPTVTQKSKEWMFRNFVDLQSEQKDVDGDDTKSDVTKSTTGNNNDDDSNRKMNAFIVNKCGYHEFFDRHGRPDMSTAICLADAAWMKALQESSNSFITCRRTCTISTGGKRCVFEMIPKEAKSKTSVDGEKSNSPTTLEDVVVEKLSVIRNQQRRMS